MQKSYSSPVSQSNVVSWPHPGNEHTLYAMVGFFGALCTSEVEERVEATTVGYGTEEAPAAKDRGGATVKDMSTGCVSVSGASRF